MGMRLLPLSIPEFCAHVLVLEREAEQRYRDYKHRMGTLGEWGLAEFFGGVLKSARASVAALERVSGIRKARDLSPWEYAWRLTYLPDAIEYRPRLVPMSGQEALQLALMSRRRAESYLRDVADNACRDDVRGHAALLLDAARAELRKLEQRLAGEVRAEQLMMVGRGGELRA